MDILSERMLRACGVGPESTVLAAFSGGADSTALLLSLSEARARGEIRALYAAHFHHGIRGDAADGDLAFCEALCRRLSVPLTVERGDVPAYAAESGKTLEEAARAQRYAFLRRAAADCGAGCIATAHHREDQAETLLLHLLRGSGLDGLTGMRPESEGVVRPLLNVSRAEIEGYLHARGQAWREDETNACTDAMRNRIRHVLTPALCGINPRAVEALCKTAALLQDDASYLDARSREAEQAAIRGDGLDRETLNALPGPLAGRIVKRRVYALQNDVTAADVRRVLALCRAQTGTRIELRSGMHAWVDASVLHIGRYPVQTAFCVPFCDDGETVFPGGCLTAGRAEAFCRPESGGEAYLDLDVLPAGLCVRTRRAGDRFHPFGAPGGRLLSDWMTDRKIPGPVRDALPLLCAGNEAYYIAGHTTSEKARVTAHTKNILHIVFREVRNGGDV